MTHKPGPRRGWSTDRGIGYCINRSRAHGRRVGHLFASKVTKGDVEIPFCSWCGKPKT